MNNNVTYIRPNMQLPLSDIDHSGDLTVVSDGSKLYFNDRISRFVALERGNYLQSHLLVSDRFVVSQARWHYRQLRKRGHQYRHHPDPGFTETEARRMVVHLIWLGFIKSPSIQFVSSADVEGAVNGS